MGTDSQHHFGETRFDLRPLLKPGSEDFSLVLMEVPGASGHLGPDFTDIDPKDWAPIHSPRAVFDDNVLSDQTPFLTGIAAGRLEKSPKVPDGWSASMPACFRPGSLVSRTGFGPPSLGLETAGAAT